MNIKNEYYKDILEFINELHIIDTHEHLEPSDIRFEGKKDVFNILFRAYISSDLISSGMTEDNYNILMDPDTDLDYRWKLLQPHLKNVSNTGYYKVLLYTLKGVFGVDELTEDTYRLIDKQIKNDSSEDLYEKILKDKCRIEYCVWDKSSKFGDAIFDRDYIRLAVRLDEFIKFVDLQKDVNHINEIEKSSGIELSNLKKCEDYMRSIVDSAIKHERCATIKNAMAYRRSLLFNNIPREEAERAYSYIYNSDQPDEKDIRIVQDYMMHETVRVSIEFGLPMQIHTGLQSGNGNFIANSNPVLLANIFKDYPEVKFDIFHGGYPYGSELATLGKNFPNVYPDLCWLHAISPLKAMEYLDEWLETVPVNKIFGFGGDYVSLEMIYGHIQAAKENIAKVLAVKVKRGDISLVQAKEYAEMILYSNPKEFFTP